MTFWCFDTRVFKNLPTPPPPPRFDILIHGFSKISLPPPPPLGRFASSQCPPPLERREQKCKMGVRGWYTSLHYNLPLKWHLAKTAILIHEYEFSQNFSTVGGGTPHPCSVALRPRFCPVDKSYTTVNGVAKVRQKGRRPPPPPPPLNGE